MVAAESFWGAPVAGGFSPEAEEKGLSIDPSALSVKQIRRILDSLKRPDPGLLARLSKDPRVTVRRLSYHYFRKGGDLAGNEEIFREGEISFLAGADEAGRGALAGPLAAAAVMFPPGVAIDGVNDSKLLEPSQREVLYEMILNVADSVSIAFVDSGLIDRWGLQLANLKALGDAVAGIDLRCQCVICDHFSLAGCGIPTYGIPKADSTFQSVAAASIVAKVTRDRLMRGLHGKFPRYNFEHNKGYGTEEHLKALSVHGPSRVHRLSFNGVRSPAEEMSFFDA